MGGVLEYFVLPVYIRINERVAAVSEFLEFRISVCNCASVVSAGDIEGVGIIICAYHVCSLRIELYLVGNSSLEVEAAIGDSPLSLDKEYSVDTFMTIKSHGGGIPEDSDAFHLFY